MLLGSDDAMLLGSDDGILLGSDDAMLLGSLVVALVDALDGSDDESVQPVCLISTHPWCDATDSINPDSTIRTILAESSPSRCDWI